MIADAARLPRRQLLPAARSSRRAPSRRRAAGDVARRRADRAGRRQARRARPRWTGRSTRTALDELLRRACTRDYPACRCSSPRTAPRSTTRSTPTARSTTRDRVALPRRAPARAATGALAAGVRAAGLLRLVAARQLRVGLGLRQALRHRLRRLRDAASASPKASAHWYSRRDRPQRARRRGRLMARARSDRARRSRRSARRPTLEEVGGARGRLARDRLARDQRVAEGQPRGARGSSSDAIAKLGYVPNQAARSLVTQRTDTVALVVSEPRTRVLRRAVLRRASSAASAPLRPRPTRPSCCSCSRTRPSTSGRAGTCRPEHVDGVLLMSLHGDDPLPRQLERAGVPDRARSAGRSGAPAAPVRRRRQPRRRPPGRRAPARPRPPHDRDDRRPAGHGRRDRPPRRLPRRARGRRAARPQGPRRLRRLLRGERRPRDGARCSPAARTSTRSSPRPT